MSTMLKKKCALTKLRTELEERKKKLCFSYKKFGHLAQNYGNKKREEKEKAISQNEFETLSSRVMQCELEEKMIKRQEEVRKVECFKYRKEEHKCRECSLWKEVKKG